MVSEVVIHVCTMFIRSTMYVHSSRIEQCSRSISCAIFAISHVHVDRLSSESKQ